MTSRLSRLRPQIHGVQVLSALNHMLSWPAPEGNSTPPPESLGEATCRMPQRHLQCIAMPPTWAKSGALNDLTPLIGSHEGVMPLRQSAECPAFALLPEPRNQGIKEPRNQGTKEPRNQGIKEPRNQGTRQPARLGSSSSLNRRPRNHLSLKLRVGQRCKNMFVSIRKLRQCKRPKPQGVEAALGSLLFSTSSLTSNRLHTAMACAPYPKQIAILWPLENPAAKATKHATGSASRPAAA